MHISSNPLARKPVIPRIAPENLRSIGPGITENWPKKYLGSSYLPQCRQVHYPVKTYPDVSVTL